MTRIDFDFQIKSYSQHDIKCLYFLLLNFKIGEKTCKAAFGIIDDSLQKTVPILGSEVIIQHKLALHAASGQWFLQVANTQNIICPVILLKRQPVVACHEVSILPGESHKITGYLLNSHGQRVSNMHKQKGEVTMHPDFGFEKDLTLHTVATVQKNQLSFIATNVSEIPVHMEKGQLVANFDTLGPDAFFPLKNDMSYFATHGSLVCAKCPCLHVAQHGGNCMFLCDVYGRTGFGPHLQACQVDFEMSCGRLIASTRLKSIHLVPDAEVGYDNFSVPEFMKAMTTCGFARSHPLYCFYSDATVLTHSTKNYIAKLLFEGIHIQLHYVAKNQLTAFCDKCKTSRFDANFYGLAKNNITNVNILIPCSASKFDNQLLTKDRDNPIATFEVNQITCSLFSLGHTISVLLHLGDFNTAQHCAATLLGTFVQLLTQV